MNKLIQDYYEAKATHDELLERLSSESERIHSVIKRVLGLRESEWGFECDAIYSKKRGTPEPIITYPDGKQTFPFYIDSRPWFVPMGYDRELPLEFFDMTDAEIEAHLVCGIEIKCDK